MHWKITQSHGLLELIQSAKNPREVADGLYLTILSRFPTDDELKIIETYSKSGVARQNEVPVDLAWALINSAGVPLSALIRAARYPQAAGASRE